MRQVPAPSETLLEDLEAALTEFEHTLEATRTGRREHVGAWASARNVLGPFRSKGESQGSGEPGVGAGPAEVEPAA
jgi:hypothetical protein